MSPRQIAAFLHAQGFHEAAEAARVIARESRYFTRAWETYLADRDTFIDQHGRTFQPKPEFRRALRSLGAGGSNATQ